MDHISPSTSAAPTNGAVAPPPREELGALKRTRDPRRRIQIATALLEQISRDASEVSRIREGAILRLHDAGMSYGAIAAIANVSRARVAQIVRKAGR